MSGQEARSAARDRDEVVERRTHTPPDDGGRKPTSPPPKPSDARRSVTAARVYDRHRVGLSAAHGGIDDVRERLSAVMSRVPSGPAYQHLLDARNSILTAQDLIQLELQEVER